MERFPSRAKTGMRGILIFNEDFQHRRGPRASFYTLAQRRGITPSGQSSIEDDEVPHDEEFLYRNEVLLAILNAEYPTVGDKPFSDRDLPDILERHKPAEEIAKVFTEAVANLKKRAFEEGHINKQLKQTYTSGLPELINSTPRGKKRTANDIPVDACSTRTNRSTTSKNDKSKESVQKKYGPESA